MKYATVCSGIGAPEAAWRDMWGEPVFTSEIEKFPSAVLKHHMPDVPNCGDMTKYKEWPDHDIELICGGTPCQSFSVAGLRKGMDDPRGNLALVYLGIIDRYRPRWVVWENVPGVLSSSGGWDFSAFVSALAELGYSCAWRVLDAQYFGVPQRRRRVFLVGHLGADWRPPFAVLFEPQGVRGDTKKGGKEGQGTAVFTTTGFGGYKQRVIACTIRAAGGDVNQGAENIVFATHFEVGPCGARETNISPTLDAGCKNGCIRNQVGALVMAHGQGNAEIVKDGSPSLTCNHEAPNNEHVAVCVHWQQGGGEVEDAISGALRSNAEHNYQFLRSNTILRRLTPMECERLQGFPDNHTRISWRGKAADQCPDGPRYKALGNSMAVPVLKWIGRRIQLWEDVSNETHHNR